MGVPGVTGKPATEAGSLHRGASRLRATPSCRNGYQNMGRVGKKNRKKILKRILILFRLWQLLAFALLAGCKEDLGEHLQSGRVLALQGLQGRWVGPVVATDPSCGATTSGLMTIGEKGFGFDPFGSSAVVKGSVTDGHLSGTLIREGADHRNLSLIFDGVASGSESINGTLQSGRCRWTVILHRG